MKIRTISDFASSTNDLQVQRHLAAIGILGEIAFYIRKRSLNSTLLVKIHNFKQSSRRHQDFHVPCFIFGFQCVKDGLGVVPHLSLLEMHNQRNGISHVSI